MQIDKRKAKVVYTPAEEVWVNERTAPHILTLGSRRGEWSGSHLSCFSPGTEPPVHIEQKAG